MELNEEKKRTWADGGDRLNAADSASEHLGDSLPEAVLTEEIEFLCYFSNHRILELVCENAKTQATPQAIASPLTHSYTQWLEAGMPCGGEGEQRPPRPRTGAPFGRGQIQRGAKGPVEFRGSQGRSACQLIKS